MSKSTHQESAATVQETRDDDQAAGLTRRTVLAGAAATTAAITIRVDTPAIAQTAEQLKEEMETFFTLSAALTGIARAKLSPFADPLDVKKQYFHRASGKKNDQQKIEQDDRRAAVFVALVKIARDANLQIPPGSPPGDGIIKQEDVAKFVTQIELAGDDVKYLARSIVLMWYLGSWYEPAELKRLATPNAVPFTTHEVISPAAYTTGLVWRVVQAHPMGYSDMQFGYWTHPPQPMVDFIGVRSQKGAKP